MSWTSQIETLDEALSYIAELEASNAELRASEKAIYERNVLTRNAHTELEAANRALQAEVERLWQAINEFYMGGSMTAFRIIERVDELAGKPQQGGQT